MPIGGRDDAEAGAGAEAEARTRLPAPSPRAEEGPAGETVAEGGATTTSWSLAKDSSQHVLRGEAWLCDLASSSRVSRACLAFLKMSKELADRIPAKALRLKEADGMPYVPCAVVGREKRRGLVKRLWVQHAVCLLMKVLGRAELVGVDEAFKLLGTKKGQAMFAWSKARAIEQEQALFGPGKGPSATVYASKAGKASALDWWDERFRAAEKAALEAWGRGEQEEREREERERSNKRKKPATLEEWELDFDRIRAGRKMGMQRKLKPVIVRLIDGDERLASLEAEVRVKLLRDVQAVCERDVDPAVTRSSNDEALSALLSPILASVVRKHLTE